MESAGVRVEVRKRKEAMSSFHLLLPEAALASQHCWVQVVVAATPRNSWPLRHSTVQAPATQAGRPAERGPTNP